MKDDNFYNILDKLYPPASKMISQLLVLVPVAFVIYLDLWKDLYIQVMIALLLGITIYSVLQNLTKRSKIISLFKEFRNQELISFLEIERNSRIKKKMVAPAENLKIVNSYNSLIETVQPNTKESISTKSLEQQIDQFITYREKDNKIAIIMWIGLNIFLIAIYFFESVRNSEPVNWGHMVFTLGIIDIVSVAIFVGINKAQSAESQVLSKYKLEIGFVIREYESKKQNIEEKRVQNAQDRMSLEGINNLLELLYKYRDLYLCQESGHIK